jgi:DNA-binding transcriptional MerR regulator
MARARPQPRRPRADVNRTEPSRANGAEGGRRVNKSATAFRTTGEVAEELDLPAHVLRFWESKFPQVKPLKRGGGRRYYRPEDVDLLRRIRQCLYQQGYTIRGVQKLLREGALRSDAPPAAPFDDGPPPGLFALEPEPPEAPAALVNPAPTRQVLREALESVRRELLEIRLLLDKLETTGSEEPS